VAKPQKVSRRDAEAQRKSATNAYTVDLFVVRSRGACLLRPAGAASSTRTELYDVQMFSLLVSEWRFWNRSGRSGMLVGNVLHGTTVYQSIFNPFSQT